jgi:fido (protein-threonine AMPylation protein)
VSDLFNRITNHPVKYYAWEAARQLSGFREAGIIPELREGLRSQDPFTRECCLEVLVSYQDDAVVQELGGLFQGASHRLTSEVESISRLRAIADLPTQFYSDLEREVSAKTPRKLEDVAVLVDTIPNIIFPEQNREYARAIISSYYTNPNFFRNLSEQDLHELHALFYENPQESSWRKYRTERLWDFGANQSPVEPYGQPFVGPSAISHIMASFVRKMRKYETAISEGAHTLRFIGESFFHQNIVHPYYDCNGRTNFLLMNLFLLNVGLPYIRMSYDDLPEYYRVLNRPNPTEFVRFLGNMLTK